ncbi:zinc-finger homeodomain protein 2-like [Phoenix dactylifera]|uniref:Zinc-finger homeodomain protein 2-like n=1 Tax=Phoenix dactylifera TaxID=42345 RepID=A0A8B7MWA0_PHODC|nr:zinc-finger homeodomain protein 2-like [Phoenix dactylifera]
MDFDDHDEPEEEIGLPVGSGYEAPLGNSGRGAAGGGKVSGGGGSGGGEAGMVAVGGAGASGNRKVSGVGGGRYRECLKNHAVNIGGHAVDGCGEFMAAGEEGTLDGLRCAACSCHRNFHRKETEGGVAPGAGVIGAEYHHQFSPYYRTPAGYLHHHHHMAAAAAAAQQQQHRPAPLALPSTSGGGGYSREEQEDISHPMMGGGGVGGGIIGSGGGGASGSGKKRFRTKFTQEQKDKMLAFAEKVGWRIQKHDEAAVQQFCEETCVKRHVLKVWMHNNKHTLGKKP